MRQLLIRVPHGHGEEAARMARAHKGTNIAIGDASDGDTRLQLVHADVSNSEVEGLLDRLEAIPDLAVTMQPRGVIALRPPASHAPDQAVDVQPRSPIEIFLSGLQSIGSWTGFLSYAAAAGVVVWIALFTEVVFLLTAAMLIAPFAGPAMNAALATARGDLYLLRQSLLRYFAALAVTIAVAFVLSIVLRQQIATGLMVEMSLRSSVAVLLPLVAGAAGALNLTQSEQIQPRQRRGDGHAGGRLARSACRNTGHGACDWRDGAGQVRRLRPAAAGGRNQPGRIHRLSPLRRDAHRRAL